MPSKYYENIGYGNLLMKNLKFTWDKIHDIAEQLEHIQSDELIDKMDTYLGHPKFDPHGDPFQINGEHTSAQCNLFGKCKT